MRYTLGFVVGQFIARLNTPVIRYWNKIIQNRCYIAAYVLTHTPKAPTNHVR